MAQLTDQECAMLEFERQRWKYAGAKTSAVHEQFDMSMTRYSQVLNQLIDRPAAMAYDARLVKRLRRVRDRRRRQRSGRRVA